MVRSINVNYLALPDNVPDPETGVLPLLPPQPAKTAAKRSVTSNTMKFSLSLVFIFLSPFENIPARKHWYLGTPKSNPPQSPLIRGEAFKSPLIRGDLEGFAANV
jgi:hypothetical protein